MKLDEWKKEYNKISEIEKTYVEWFEKDLEEVHDEAINNALKHLAKLSEIRRLKSDLYADALRLQLDIKIDPISKRVAEEREFLNKLR